MVGPHPIERREGVIVLVDFLAGTLWRRPFLMPSGLDGKVRG